MMKMLLGAFIGSAIGGFTGVLNMALWMTFDTPANVDWAGPLTLIFLVLGIIIGAALAKIMEFPKP